MTNSITRRNFLRTTLASGALLLINPRGLLALQTDGVDDYIVAKKVEKREATRLEELLKNDPKPASSPDGTINLNVNRFPEITYHIGMKETKGSGETSLSLNSCGSAFILNDTGFFISAHHVFDDFISRKKEGHKDLMLIYDPKNGIMLPADVLIYSPKEKYDILLGKVDIDSKYPIKTTKVSSNPKPSPLYVYSTKYNNMDYITSNLISELITPDSLHFEPSGLVYRQKKPLEKELGTDLGLEAVFGQEVSLIDQDGNIIKEDGKYQFKSEMIPGNSGCPVFNLDNELMGVVTHRGEFQEINGENINLGIYTGPLKIREMITKYLNAIK